LRERGFELKRRLVSERRVQPLFVVDFSDEPIDLATSIADVGKCLAVDLFSLERLMKLSALALSKGLPGRLMLTAMSRSASRWR
jgi:hypothetical protein